MSDDLKKKRQYFIPQNFDNHYPWGSKPEEPKSPDAPTSPVGDGIAAPASGGLAESYDYDYQDVNRLADHLKGHAERNAHVFSDADKDAVISYTKNSSFMNKHLFKKKDAHESGTEYSNPVQDERAESVSSAIKKTVPYDRKFTVYSGMHHAIPTEIIANNGGVFHVPKFMSTSTHPDIAQRFASKNHADERHIVKLDLPAGFNKGTYVGGMSHMHDEHEYLIDKDQLLHVSHKIASYKDAKGNQVHMWHGSILNDADAKRHADAHPMAKAEYDTAMAFRGTSEAIHEAVEADDIPNFDRGLDMMRRSLPQIDKEAMKADFKGKYSVTTLKPSSLTPSQKHFNDKKVQYLVKNPVKGEIIVSKDNYVIDGHHRWLADHIAGRKSKAIVVHMNAHDLIDHLGKADYTFTKKLNENIKGNAIKAVANIAISSYVDKRHDQHDAAEREKAGSAGVHNAKTEKPSFKEKIAKTAVNTIVDHDSKLNEAIEHPMIDVGDGVMKHTTNSEGDRIHDTDDGIKNFHKWFGDSKVVDKYGRPRVIYHGSGAEDITKFDPDRAGSVQYSDWGKGVYTTTSKSNADYYRVEAVKKSDEKYNKLYAKYETESKGSRTINGTPQYTDEAKAALKKWQEHCGKLDDTKKGKTYALYAKIENPHTEEARRSNDPYLSAAVREKGHDGIVVTGSYSPEIIPFHSHQLKSAEKNTGDYSHTGSIHESEAIHPMVDIDGVMKHTTNSEGNVIHHSPEGIKNFHNWFGDSKAVEERTSSRQKQSDMRPLVLYHGTRSDIKNFNTSTTGTVSHTFGSYKTSRHGIYMTPDKSFADSFATQGSEREGANIIPLYHKTKNPLDIRNGFSEEDFAHLSKHGMSERIMSNFRPHLAWEHLDGDDGLDFVNTVKKAGYDSIVMSEDHHDTGNPVDVHVALHPNNVKSALGNHGGFEDSKSIHESLSDETFYHGSKHDVQSVDHERFGTGHDENGPGFYMTNSSMDSHQYAMKNGRYVDGSNIMPVKHGIKNPMPTNHMFTHAHIRELVKNAPDENLENYEQVTPKNRNAVVDRVAAAIHSSQRVDIHRTGVNTLNILHNDLYNGHANKLLAKVHELTGYDGVIVQRTPTVKHAVAWFPHQVKGIYGNQDTNTPGIMENEDE